MKPTFITLPACKIIGIHDIQVPENIVPQMWEKFFKEEHCSKIPNQLESDEYFGVAYKGVFEDGKFKQCDYCVGKKVSSLEEIPDNMVGLDIPETFYAKFTHKGSLNKLYETYQYIYGEWLIKSGYEYNPSYELEIYDSRFKMGNPDSEFDIYIPIEKK